MTHHQTADLLKRAATRLSLAYFAELEKERNSRWDGDVARADVFRDEAEEILALVEQCRAAASRLASDTVVRRNRARGRDGNERLIAAHSSVRAPELAPLPCDSVPHRRLTATVMDAR